MRFLTPEWFVLIAVLAAAGWYWPRLDLLRPWRLLLCLLMVLLLTQPQIRRLSDGLDLWVLVDRSDSARDVLPPVLPEWESLLDQTRGSNDRLRFIDFAGEAVERGALIRAGSTDYDGPRATTRTASAIGHALSRMDPDRASRLLLLSDGFSTEPLSGLTERLRNQQVPLDTRLAGATVAGDVRLAAFVVPHRVLPREAFMLELVAVSDSDGPVPVELLRNGTSIGNKEIVISGGAGRLRLTDRIGQPGAYKYEARLLPAKDTLAGNNSAAQWVEVETGPRVLLVSSLEGDPMGAAMQAQGFEVQTVTDPAKLHVGLLSAAKVVVLNNVPAYRMQNEFLSALTFFVNEQGGGLIMVGGKYSFAAGGYFGSAVEPLLPVSMELKQEHRKLAVAVAIVLDRSGSMRVTVPGSGLQKMQLADEGAARAIELLGDSDQVALIPVDSAAHVIAPLTPLGPNRASLTNLARRIESTGGGIFVYTGLAAAWKELQMAEVGQRHVILFADANDAEEPGEYVRLIDDMVKNKCTVSVIGMGTDTDKDADFLKDVALKGKGRIFFNADASELPALFAQETVAVARSAFIEEPVPVKGTAGWTELAASPMAWLPTTDGYNLSYLKPGAAQAAVSGDEYAAPLVAFWQRGAGRVAAVSFPLGGDFSARTRAWGQYGDLVQSLTRWLMGETLPPGLGVRTAMDGTRLVTDLYYDETWNERIAAAPPRLLLATGSNGKTETTAWERLAPGHFHASVDLPGDQWVRGAVQVGSAALPFGPINAAINPEWSFDRSRLNELKAVSQRSGGVERVDLSDVWKAPRAPAWRGLERWLLVALLLVLMIEAWRSRIGKRV